MESYDTILLSSFYAYPTFQQKFGDMISPGVFSVPAQWQTALSLGGSIGIILGIYLNGFLVDRFGHRTIILGSLVVLTGFIGIVFAAESRGMLLAGQILSGLPWGTLNVIARESNVADRAEISRVCYRNRSTRPSALWAYVCELVLGDWTHNWRGRLDGARQQHHRMGMAHSVRPTGQFNA